MEATSLQAFSPAPQLPRQDTTSREAAGYANVNRSDTSAPEYLHNHLFDASAGSQVVARPAGAASRQQLEASPSPVAEGERLMSL
jgi:hypothetical protein